MRPSTTHACAAAHIGQCSPEVYTLARARSAGARFCTAQRAIASSGWRVLSPSLTRVRSSNSVAPSTSTRIEPNGSSPSSRAARASSTQRRRRSRSSLLIATGRSLRSRALAAARPGHWIAPQPEQQRTEVAELGEVAFDGQRDGEKDERGHDVEPAPPRGNVVGEHAHDADDEVAHADVARVDQPRGGYGLLDPPVPGDSTQ